MVFLRFMVLLLVSSTVKKDKNIVHTGCKCGFYLVLFLTYDSVLLSWSYLHLKARVEFLCLW